MLTDSEPIRRADVRLNCTKLTSFFEHCLKHGHELAEVFQDTNLYLESNGTIVVEFHPPKGTLHYETFQPSEWEPSKNASLLTRKLLESVRPRPPLTEVYDIFTGQPLDQLQISRRTQWDF